MLVSLRAPGVGAFPLPISSTQPPPSAPVRPPNRGDAFSVLQMLLQDSTQTFALRTHLFSAVGQKLSCPAPWLRDPPQFVVTQGSFLRLAALQPVTTPYGRVPPKKTPKASLLPLFSWEFPRCHKKLDQSAAVTDNSKQTFLLYFSQQVIWMDCCHSSPPVTLWQHQQTAVDDWQW